MTHKKLAVIRSNGIRECPFGLSIPQSCRAVGNAIYDMQPLDDVPEDERERYKQSNRRVFRHSAEDKQCPFLEGVVKNREMVNCDYGDSAAGMRSVPFAPSPYYPRVFGNFSQSSLLSWPIGSYNDNVPGRSQLFDGLFQAMYSSQDLSAGLKVVGAETHYEISGGSARTSLNFAPTQEVSSVYVRDSSGELLEQFETDSLKKAQEWAMERIEAGKTVDVEVELSAPHSLSMEPSGASQIELMSHPAAFLRFTSVDGAPFILQYRKIENQQTELWQHESGAEGAVKRPAETVDFYTVEPQTDPANK